PKEERRLVLRALALAPRPRTVPPKWADALVAALADKDLDLVREAAQAARGLPLKDRSGAKLVEQLRQLGADVRLPADVRLSALSGVPGSIGPLKAELFTFVLGHLDKERAVAARAQAADVLSRAALTKGQLLELAGALKSVGPMELDKVLDP